MLVLTRRQSEAIIIANNIKITVVSVGPGRVKLGIEAPPDVRIDRQEIHDKIEQSSDVLAALGGSPAAHESPNTSVGHGPDTALIVGSGESRPSPPAGEPVPAKKLGDFRPRKPR